MRLLTLALPLPVRPLSVRLFFALAAVSALALAPGLLVDNSTRLASLAINSVSPDADRYSYDPPAATTSRAIHSYDDSRNSVGQPRAHSGSAIAAEAGATTRWLRGTAGNAGPVPASVAAALRGQTFSSPKQFREAFWRAAAADPSLAGQFSASNVTRMGKGLAPRVVPSQRLGGQGSYILHHRTPLNRGGAPYDPENILVVTARYHKEVLEPGYHYGGGG